MLQSCTKLFKTPPLIRFYLGDLQMERLCCWYTVLTIYCTVYAAAGKGEEMSGVVVSWLISGALTHNEAKLSLILQHGNPHRNPLQQPTGGSPDTSGHGKKMRAAAYLSRLGRGMEPEPDPSIPFFPLNNFSTRATFPVRAASSSSCSFPIPDTSLQRRGDKNPTNLPYIPSPLLSLRHLLSLTGVGKHQKEFLSLHPAAAARWLRCYWCCRAGLTCTARLGGL